jgi:glutathione S-transferase
MPPPIAAAGPPAPTMPEPTANMWNIYHAPGFSSAIVVQIAQELGLIESNKMVVNAIKPSEGGDSIQVLKTDPVLGRLSPRRVLPVAVLPDGSTMCETGAIALAILETFDKAGKLHPVAGKGDISATRAQFLQGIVYAVTEGYPSVMKIFELCYCVPKEKRDSEAIAELKRTSFQPVVEAHLVRVLTDGREYYLGAEFSAVDACFGYILMVAAYCDAGVVGHRLVLAYHARLSAMKSYKELYDMILRAVGVM